MKVSTLRFDRQSAASNLHAIFNDFLQCNRGKGSYVYAAFRASLTEQEIRDAAYFQWVNRGSPPEQSLGEQDLDRNAGIRELYNTPIGFVAIHILEGCIGVRLIHADSKLSRAQRVEVYRSMLEKIIAIMKEMNGSGSQIRAVVMPFISDEAALVVMNGAGWCSITTTEAGKIWFFQHDHA